MSNNNYITAGAITGGLIGGIHGFRNPNEKSITKIMNLKPSIPDMLKGYRDCIDIKTAGQAVRNGKINLKEYTDINGLRTAIHNAYEKEKAIIDIMNTQIKKRAKSFEQTLKEANSARSEIFKRVLKMPKELKNKLTDLKIFNKEGCKEITKAGLKKSAKTLKELSKNGIKGLVIGAAVGALLGYTLKVIRADKS